MKAIRREPYTTVYAGVDVCDATDKLLRKLRTLIKQHQTRKQGNLKGDITICIKGIYLR